MSINSIESVVRGAISKKGMTFKHFCQEVGLSDVALRAIFKRNDAKISDLRRMGDVLDLNMCSVLCGEIGTVDGYSVEVKQLRAEIGYLKEIVRLKEEIIRQQHESSN